MSEVWKPLNGCDDLYEISSFGRVRNKLTKHIHSQHQHVTGYSIITLGGHKRGKRYRVHRLVAETFIPNPNKYPEVNHKDGDKQNNRVDNLEWCTRSDNVKHSYDTNLKRSSSAKLTNSEVSEIKRVLREVGYENSLHALSDKFKVSKSTIWNIYNGRTWKNVL